MSQSQSQAVQAENRISVEWLSSHFAVDWQMVGGRREEMGWKVARKSEVGIATRMRVLEVGVESFVIEIGQGEESDETRYSTGVGIHAESIEHLDQLVAAFRLEYY